MGDHVPAFLLREFRFDPAPRSGWPAALAEVPAEDPAAEPPSPAAPRRRRAATTPEEGRKPRRPPPDLAPRLLRGRACTSSSRLRFGESFLIHLFISEG